MKRGKIPKRELLSSETLPPVLCCVYSLVYNHLHHALHIPYKINSVTLCFTYSALFHKQKKKTCALIFGFLITELNLRQNVKDYFHVLAQLFIEYPCKTQCNIDQLKWCAAELVKLEVQWTFFSPEIFFWFHVLVVINCMWGKPFCFLEFYESVWSFETYKSHHLFSLFCRGYSTSEHHWKV